MSLAAPRLHPEYPQEILAAAGHAMTEGNISRMTAQVATMFLIKSQQFIESVDARAAALFAARHPHAASVADLQGILDDLGSWVAVLPYAQDLPARIRALLLEQAGKPGTIWDDYDR